MKRVYLDIDGVLADYDKAIREGTPRSDFVYRRDTFLNLDPFPNSIESVSRIEQMGFDTWILGKLPKKNPYAATEKVLWIHKYFPQLISKIVLTFDKGAVGSPHDFLIDDHPEWANAMAFKGTVIKFRGNWEPVLQYLSSTIEQ